MNESMFVGCKTKNDFRRIAKEIRNSLAIADVSKKLVTQIRNLELYKSAKMVMIYYPVGSEYNLLPLLEDNKKFLFPVIKGDEIYPVQYDKVKGFKLGKFNINEPIGDIIVDFESLDLLILPALCCSKKGCRLGYGKGFYDRFLAKISSNVATIIAIHSSLLLENIPSECHDEKVDVVVSEEKVYSCALF